MGLVLAVMMGGDQLWRKRPLSGLTTPERPDGQTAIRDVWLAGPV
jgi:hypothetical protein